MGRNKGARRVQAKKRKRLLAEEIEELETKIKETAPAPGTNPLLQDQDEDQQTDGTKPRGQIKRDFADQPIGSNTLQGLNDAQFTKMTSIQRATLAHALVGRDVLAAAKTGSGKTLAFLVPVLEKLYRLRWCHTDGLGALIISPTRELALQIFEVLRQVGQHHSLSAGLVIGGKDQKAESERIGSMNILVCTPGRLLHHMDMSSEFDTSNLQILVLDEADRILDLGFERCINAIVGNLPVNRQTLLFSATQTKSVKSLARLSLKNPEYISVHEKDEYSTPNKLKQNVLFCSLEDKVNTVWSFLRTHTNEKSIIFLSSCKQVRFYYEAFRLLRPGCPITALHGKIKQMKRLATYKDFCEREGGCALFATDLASRGLDFNNVDWVIQADCPESTDTYIHRVGRTARYRKAGKALLVLLPSEKAMLDHLESRRVPLTQIKVNPKRNQDIASQLLSLNSQNPELKYLAQKAFVSYVRSVHLNSSKDVFDASALPLKEYAESMGLIGTPRIRFIKNIRPDKNIPLAVAKAKADIEERKSRRAQEEHSDEEESISDYSSDEEDDIRTKVVKTKAEKQRSRVNQGTLSEHYTKLIEDEESDDSEEDLLVSKRLDHELDEEEMAPTKLSNRMKKRLLSENVSGLNKRVVFDDDGKEMNSVEAVIHNLPEKEDTTHEKYISSIREELKRTDREDYLHAKELRREKKQLQKERAKRKAMEEAGYTVTLAGGDDYDDDMGYSDAEDDSPVESENDDDSSSEEDETYPGAGMKRSRRDDDDEYDTPSKRQKGSVSLPDDIESMEERALRLLEEKGL